MTGPESSTPKTSRCLAWGVHLFTATGAVFALLAMIAIQRGRGFEALLWLFAALVVDAIDGTLARAARVRERLPQIHGESLDLVVDYLTYVFVPVLFLWRGEYFPEQLAIPLAAAICVSSLYVFAREDMKSDDGYFRGFPALWNIIALYFFIAPPSQPVAVGIALALVLMTFAPVHVVHPFRVRDYGWFLPGTAMLWAAATFALLLPNWSHAAQAILLTVSLAAAGAIIGMGLLRSVRGPRTGR